jgi:ribosomal protein L37AE/L43A
LINSYFGAILMTKKTFCPRCGSKKIKWEDPQMSIWKCRNCGYEGSIVIEDGNLEKNIKEARKLDKLSKKLSRRR